MEEEEGSGGSEHSGGEVDIGDEDEGQDDAGQFDEEEEMEEGFEDWNLDDACDDAEGQLDYEDEGEYPIEEQDELPELIYTEGCDAEVNAITPCISLQRCGNRLVHLPTHSPDGNVDAVRVMLLGVNDLGRPSVGIDLGYACTQPNGNGGAQRRSQNNDSSHSSPSTLRSSTGSMPSSGSVLGGFGGFMGNSPGPRSSFPVFGNGGSGTSSVSSSTEFGNTSFTGGLPASAASSPPRPDAHGSGAAGDVGRSTSPGSMACVLPRASTNKAFRPVSPFVFQRPRTPSLSPNHPSARKSFVFSEWASSNKQTFVFEGSHTTTDSGGHRHSQPCKFVPTKSLTLAVQDAGFIKQVLSELPGVDCSDLRIKDLIDGMRATPVLQRPTTPSQQSMGAMGGSLKTPTRPKIGKRQTIPFRLSADEGK